MVQKFSWVLLVLLVLVGCGDEFTEDEEKALKDLVKDKIVWKKDGKEMVLIPAGSFEMGDSKNEPEEWMEDSRPVHTVELDAFYMDVHEVTRGQFKQFVVESGYGYARRKAVANYLPGDDYPMVYVSWNDVTAYCEWAGKRLPTEAEWEYAARGGLSGIRYPWGDDDAVARAYANYDGISAIPYHLGGRDQWDETAPVGSFAANGYGLYDMSGNVWEWCSDWYGENYYSSSPVKNPPGPDTGSEWVLRGGSWLSSMSILRVAYRHYNNSTPSLRNHLTYGFRCVSGF